ncbi:MAG: hypothetical protein WBY94_28610 [Polyangiaceae bacterium]
MDTRIANSAHPDLVMIESAARPTPTPTRVSFSQVLATGVGGIVQGAELAASSLPGAPITAAAIRGGLNAMSATVGSPGVTLNTTPEGPSGVAGAATGIGVGVAGVGASGTSTDPSGSIDASLAQSAQMNLYYLQIQQEVDSQNRSFTALSNVLKTEHDSAKSAIGNIHS